MITHTISWVEVIWTLVALIGVLTNSRVFRLTLGDYDALQEAPDYDPYGPRAYYARGRIRTEAIKLVVMLGYTLIGLVAMTTPPSVNGTLTPSALTIAGVLIGSSALMMYDSVLYTMNRERVLYLLLHRQETEQISNGH